MISDMPPNIRNDVKEQIENYQKFTLHIDACLDAKFIRFNNDTL